MIVLKIYFSIGLGGIQIQAKMTKIFLFFKVSLAHADKINFINLKTIFSQLKTLVIARQRCGRSNFLLSFHKYCMSMNLHLGWCFFLLENQTRIKTVPLWTPFLMTHNLFFDLIQKLLMLKHYWNFCRHSFTSKFLNIIVLLLCVNHIFIVCTILLLYCDAAIGDYNKKIIINETHIVAVFFLSPVNLFLKP